MTRSKNGLWILFLCSILLVAAGCSCLCERDRGLAKVGSELPSVTLNCQKPALAENGMLGLDVTISNTTASPVILTVCDEMSLCCIRGMHPIVELVSDEEGMGALDFCATAKPTGHKVRLAPGTRFGSTLNLPADRLPSHYLQEKGRALTVYCVLETDRGMIKSNVIEVTVE